MSNTRRAVWCYFTDEVWQGADLRTCPPRFWYETPWYRSRHSRSIVALVIAVIVFVEIARSL